MISELSVPAWICLFASALLVGMAKNGIPGIGIIIVPLMVANIPAKPAMGILLPMLIAGDMMAIRNYRRHTQWHQILGLFPWVAAGLLLAWWTLDRLDSEGLEFWLAVIMLGLVGFELIRRRWGVQVLIRHPVYSGFLGTLAGFSSTLANLAGPIMSVYLLSRDLDKTRFVGTAAWFFFLLNTSKLPVYWQQDMITRSSLTLDLLMLPIILCGAWAGVRLLPRIPQRLFNQIILAVSALAAVMLLLK